MADASTFGGGTAMDGAQDTGAFGASFGGGAPAPGPGAPTSLAPPPAAPPQPSTPSVFGTPDPSQPAPASAPQSQGLFGSGLSMGGFGQPKFTKPDPNATALDQSADLLQQQIKIKSNAASNPIANFFDPEGAAKARAAVPALTEQLQQIQQQKAKQVEIQKMAVNYGITNIPQGADRETATNLMADELQARYLAGDPLAAQGLQQLGRTDLVQAGGEQAISAAMANNQRYRDAVGKLNNMRNPGEYAAAYAELQQQTKDGVHGEHELASVPKTFDEFQQKKQQINNALSMQQMQIGSMQARMQQLGGVVPIQKAVDKDGNAIGMHAAVASQVRDNNGNAMGGVEPVTVGGIYNGNRLPSGSADINSAGVKWGLMTKDEVKDVGERIKPEHATLERASGINKLSAITDAKDFSTNPFLFGHAVDQFVEISRNGIGGKGSATPGTIQMMENVRGHIQTWGDKAQKEWRQVEAWVDGGKKGPMPYVSQETKQQFQSAITTLKTGSDKEIGGVAGATAEYVGRHGGKIDDLGLEPGLQDTVRDRWAKGNQEFKQDIASRPAVVSGGQRIVFDRDGVKPPTALAPGGFDQQQSASPPAPGAGTPPPAAPSQQGPSGSQPGGGQPQDTGKNGPDGQAPGPITVAGQQISVPPIEGASPGFLPAVQRIESGNEKTPWQSGNGTTSAKGAFQIIGQTWKDNRPAGAPDDPSKATPQQQAEATATYANKNAAALKGAGVPVNDTNLYIAHNLGTAGGPALLRASPNADARTVVGETAARNNPLFFRGRPTVATVLQRYDTEMNGKAPKDATASLPDTGDNPGLMTRVGRMLSQGIAGTGADKDKAAADVGNAAVNNAPAIGSTVGAVGGGVVAGPAGAVGGGAAGGGAGQALKDYLEGNAQSPAKIAEQTALGGVLGVGGAARPVLGAAARAVGAGAVEAGAAKLEGGENSDALNAGLKGVGYAAGGEMFGRALGMVGHKVWNMFAPDAKAAVQAAAKSYADAQEVLKTEPNRLPGVGTAAGGPNPKYIAAEEASGKAETVLKDAGLSPEEAAYAHKVSSEGVPKQEAQAARPGALEEKDVGKGYQQLESEVASRGVGAPKASPKLADGPRAAVENKQVSAKHAELADHVEMAITAPAANWQEKWTQLKDARSQLLQAERDALSSTSPGKAKIAADMRTLADTVRVQQEKAANYVFGPQDGTAFMGRLKVLDTRYRNLMEATNGGDIAGAAAMKGEAGREADKKFRAFAHDDPAALQAWGAMRGAKNNIEKDVLQVISAEKIPLIGKAVSLAKLAGGFKEWMRERTAGSPAKFADFINQSRDETGKLVRDMAGTAAQRELVQ